MIHDRRVHGRGLATVAADGTVLDTWYPAPASGGLGDGPDVEVPPPDERRGVSFEAVAVESDLDAPVRSTPDAYLRLHALSHLLVRPGGVNLDTLFAHLPVVAWTTAGPMAPDEIQQRRMALQRGGIQVQSLDRFPRLTDYLIPAGVRIGDASRVRLGAHLSPGTTVMHEGFVNFNAGTLGAGMIEGRVSQGVVIGDGSDIGGGASIMGTLSGGGTHRVSIGARSLLGANAGLGISLGDDCIVEAGLYLTAGTKVSLADRPPTADGTRPIVNARELSGSDGILYRRNSVSGAVEALRRRGAGVALNATLHT